MEATRMANIRIVEYKESLLQSDNNKFPNSQRIIHGTTKAGKAVTLVECFFSHRNETFSSKEIQFDVRHVIFDNHFLMSGLVFDEIQLEFDYLDDWITYSRFEAKDLIDEENQREIRIRLNRDHQIPFQTPEYATSQFFVGYSSTYSAFKFSIHSSANLQITFPAGQPLTAILKEITQWEWFLTLATAHKTTLKSVSVFRKDLRFDLGVENFKRPHDMWISAKGQRSNPKTLHPPQMTFTLPTIENELSSIIGRWKAIQTRWAAVLHRYFASIHRQGLQLHEQFLYRAQAIEAMHRAGTKATKVQQKTAYGAAWEQAPHALQKRLGDKNSFVEAVNVNRNYLTHYNPADEIKTSDFADLFYLSQKMGFVLEAAILTEIGVPDSVISAATSARRWASLVQFEDES